MDKKKIKKLFFSIRLVIEDTMVKLTIVISANAGKKIIYQTQILMTL